MRDYHQLHVWQEGYALTLDVYRLTSRFPAAERFGLVSQLRRATASIPTNLAEGCGRRSNREFAYFVRVATGSAMEARFLVELSVELGFVDDDGGLIDRLTALARRLRSLDRRLAPGPTHALSP